MSAINIFYLCAGYLIFLFAQSFFINGIWIASSGETETMPDGNKKHSPMILYPIARRINSSIMKPVYFSGTELYKLLDSLSKRFRSQFTFPEKIVHENIYYTKGEEFTNMVMIGEALKNEGIKYSILQQGSESRISFFKEYKEYKYSKWLRMPTFGCIRCMSSFWSLFTYWLPMVAVFGFHWWMVPLWIFNISAVTFLNTLLAQRYTL